MVARILTAFIVALAALVPVPAAAQGTYQLPATGPIVGVFDAPSEYGPGHRGIDLRVVGKPDVVAMASGIVSFAGRVITSDFVTVDHAEGLRTTVGPLRDLQVEVGDPVAGGQLLGYLGEGFHGVPGLVHVSVRSGDTYIDPMLVLSDATPTLVDASVVGTGRRERAESGRRTLVPGTAPSPNHLVVLAGYGSHTGDLPFDPALLGYDAQSASQFSYVTDADGRPVPYDPEHTWEYVHQSALALRRQLRQRWAEHPGQAVDLVGHSLGGLVAMYYLLGLHDPADPTLPPIGRVATIASPLDGTEAAGAIAKAKGDLLGLMLTGIADRAVGRMSPDAAVMDDLVPGSDATRLVQDAWKEATERPYEGPLATGTTVMTMGAVLDPVVPEHRTDLPGVPHRAVWDTHGGAPTDRVALQTLEAYLAGEPLPGAGFSGFTAGLMAPVSHLIGWTELAIGSLAG